MSRYGLFQSINLWKNFQIHTIKNEHRVNSTAKRRVSEVCPWEKLQQGQEKREWWENGQVALLSSIHKYIKRKQRLVNSTPQFSLWNHQRCSRGHKKKSEAKDTPSEDRPYQCQRTKDITRKNSRKKKPSLKKSQIFRKIPAIFIKKRSSLENSQVLWRAPAMLMTLANFQQVKK